MTWRHYLVGLFLVLFLLWVLFGLTAKAAAEEQPAWLIVMTSARTGQHNWATRIPQGMEGCRLALEMMRITPSSEVVVVAFCSTEQPRLHWSMDERDRSKP